MNYLIITSKRIRIMAKDIYRKEFNVKKVPKDGIIYVEHPILNYYNPKSQFHDAEVLFEEPLKDIQSTLKRNKINRSLNQISDQDNVVLYGLIDTKYTWLIHWEIRKIYQLKDHQVKFIHLSEAFIHFKNRLMWSYEVSNEITQITYEKVTLRKLIGLMILKRVIYDFSQENIYGPPLNTSTFFLIKLKKKYSHLTPKERRKVLDTEIINLDITLYQPFYNSGISRGKVIERMYDHLSEDIIGFKDDDFIPHLMEQLERFSHQRITYDEYITTLNTIFGLKRRD